MPFYEDKAGQTISVLAVNAAGVAVADDAANITAVLSIDGDTTPNATDDLHPIAIGGGMHEFSMLQTETAGKKLTLIPSSTTPGVVVRPVVIYTDPLHRLTRPVVIYATAVTGSNSNDGYTAAKLTLAAAITLAQRGDTIVASGIFNEGIILPIGVTLEFESASGIETTTGDVVFWWSRIYGKVKGGHIHFTSTSATNQGDDWGCILLAPGSELEGVEIVTAWATSLTYGLTCDNNDQDINPGLVKITGCNIRDTVVAGTGQAISANTARVVVVNSVTSGNLDGAYGVMLGGTVSNSGTATGWTFIGTQGMPAGRGEPLVEAVKTRVDLLATQASVNSIPTTPLLAANVPTRFSSLTISTGGKVSINDTIPTPPTVGQISTQVASDLATAHGSGAWGSSETGTGANTVTITVNDGTAALEGAKVRMYQGAESYLGTTNVSGVVVFGLDSATWNVAITEAGYTFTPTTKIVSVNPTTQTYSMTLVSVTAATAPLCNCYIVVYNTSDVAATALTMSFRMVKTDGTDGRSFAMSTRTATSSTNGLLQISLARLCWYQMSRNNAIWGDEFQVPDADTFQLPELI